MKKEIVNKSERMYMGDGQYMTRGNCPNCNESLYTYSHRFVMFEKCPVCNQELDWGKKNKIEDIAKIVKERKLSMANKYYKVENGFFTCYVNKSTGEKKFNLDENDVEEEMEVDDFNRLTKS